VYVPLKKTIMLKTSRKLQKELRIERGKVMLQKKLILHYLTLTIRIITWKALALIKPCKLAQKGREY
jgi:hypothetical protein